MTDSGIPSLFLRTIPVEKALAIDWSNPDDILAHSYTLHRIAALHPLLAQHLASLDSNDREHLANVFIDVECLSERRRFLQKFHEMQLFVLSTERWCVHCSCSGHTKFNCPHLSVSHTSSVDPPSSREVPHGSAGLAWAKYREHIALLEKNKVLAAKQRVGSARSQKAHERRVAQQQKVQSVTIGVAASGYQAEGRGVGGAAGGGVRGTATNAVVTNSASSGAAFDMAFSGVISQLDPVRRDGMIQCSAFGDIRFYADRLEFGLKNPKVGDIVAFRVEVLREKQTPTEITPIDKVLSAVDIFKFLEEADACGDPIPLMWKCVASPLEDWRQILLFLRGRSVVERTKAVISLVRLATFSTNREAIHGNLMQRYLALLLTDGQTTTGRVEGSASSTHKDNDDLDSIDGQCRFFPEFLSSSLKHLIAMHETTETIGTAQVVNNDTHKFVDVILEFSEFLLLLREHHLGPSDVSLIAHSLSRFAQHQLTSVPPHSIWHRKLASAIKRCDISSREKDMFSSFPTSEELSNVLNPAKSIFCSKNLPVSVTRDFKSPEDLVRAQMTLLKSDTFEKAARVLLATCFPQMVPPHTGKKHNNPLQQQSDALDSAAETHWPDSQTIEEARHYPLFCNVQYLGRAVSRTFNFSTVNGHVFSLSEYTANDNSTTANEDKSSNDISALFSQPTKLTSSPSGVTTKTISWNTVLPSRAVVCICTGLDRSCVEKDEVFWAEVADQSGTPIRRVKTVVLQLLSGDINQLIKNLERNKSLKKSFTHSTMLETSVFLVGYKSVQRALQPFIAVSPMTLPLSKFLLVSPKNHLAPQERYASTVGYVPQYCKLAFDHVIDVMRSNLTLDSGQDEALRSLSTNPLVLVQGPPGTGKSFIGCRIAEAYIRLKHLISTGDIFSEIDLETLPGTNLNKATPEMGPVVVITYKNHALDEFLLDLLKSPLWDRELHHRAETTAAQTSSYYPRGVRLVRVGGVLSEGQLQPYNLVSLRDNLDRRKLSVWKKKVYAVAESLERLGREMRHLESGFVPGSIFLSALTDSQKEHFAFNQLERWLAGDNYQLSRDESPEALALANDYYRSLLQTQMRQIVSTSLQVEKVQPSKPAVNPEDSSDDEGLQGTVFGDMRKELSRMVRAGESSEWDSEEPSLDFVHLRDSFISAEALDLASQGPVQPPSSINADLLSLWSLNRLQRHEFTAFVLRRAIRDRSMQYVSQFERLTNLIALRNHAADSSSLDILRGADVIGLTTTGCAIQQSLICSLRPRVLIVEEAAEVLESQLLACMTDSLQQLVLIGDHYQLQPKIETYEYELHNNMNVSMFERLARFIKPVLLREQRRMHPSISRLIRPYYSEGLWALEDHASVLHRPFTDSKGRMHTEQVPGLVHRIFFWTHQFPEEIPEGSLSKINRKELTRASELVQHLVTEGISPQSIAVITPYLAQRRALSERIQANGIEFRNVRVSTVDLFQGDENDIIILSMVRTAKVTDFVKLRNRMIVALSRARFALIILGNEQILTRTPHWKGVIDSLSKDRLIGPEMPVRMGQKTFIVGKVANDQGKADDDVWPDKKRMRD